MKALTVDDILKLNPCGRYKREYIEWLFAGRETLTLADVVDMQTVPAIDVMWLACRVFTRRQRVILACKCAEDVGMFEIRYNLFKYRRYASDSARNATAHDKIYSIVNTLGAASYATDAASYVSSSALCAARERQLLYICETILETDGE